MRFAASVSNNESNTGSVLNRIYIVVGLLAILTLGAAFVAPRFIQWGDYRQRMEALAAGVFGAPVVIRGDIEFTLLPQPLLRFSDVTVGADNSPSLQVQDVEAEFSLMDFLSDRYTIKRLLLVRPLLSVGFSENGEFATSIALPAEAAESSVSIANATVQQGGLRVADARSQGTLSVDDIEGELDLGTLRGPFEFQGSGMVGEKRYSFRFNAAALEPEGRAGLTAFAQPDDGAFSLSTEGTLFASVMPRFEGSLVYRQAPVDVEGDVGRGDLVLESAVLASSEQVLLNSYTLVPDENRPGTRLTGAASVRLGQSPAFQALISGGVLSLPQRDATKDQTGQPYELVRLLDELQPPTIIPMPGTLNVDIAEVSLRAISLRDVRLDAVTDGKSWRIQTFVARLPGDTGLQLQGQLSTVEGRPAFAGHAVLSSTRLNGLAQLWRSPDDVGVLFNLPAAVETDVNLRGDRLDLTNSKLIIDGQTHEGSAGMAFGPERRLDLNLVIGTLDAVGSAALAALLPDLRGDPTFSTTFPQGALSVQARSANLFGLSGTNLAAQGSWGPDGLVLNRAAADEFGGVSFDLLGAFAGPLDTPVVSLAGSVKVTTGDAPALPLLYDLWRVPQPVRDALGRSLPAELSIDLTKPSAEGSQVLTLKGWAGSAQVKLRAQFAAGLNSAATAPLSAALEIDSDDAAVLTRQMGWGDLDLFPRGAPMQLRAEMQGTLTESIELRVAARAAADSAGFDGLVVPAEGGVNLNGTAMVKLSEASGLAELLGGGGIYLPEVEANATLQTEGSDRTTLSEIAGTSLGRAFTGELELERGTTGTTVSGALDVENLELGGLAAAVAGPASVQSLEGGLWPDAPFVLPDSPRTSSGAVRITTELMLGGNPLVEGASFDLAWDATEMRVRALSGELGGGKIEGDLALCCASPLPDKQLSGRISIVGADLDVLLPPAPGSALGGRVDVGVQFNGTGASFAAVSAALSGEGSFAARDFTIMGLDPAVFPTIAGLDNIIELPSDALSNIAALAVARNAFAAPQVNGAFTIAGGTLRIANLAAEGAGGRVFGGLNLRLADLGLSGSFSLSPVGVTDRRGLISEATSQVTTTLSGTLLAPEQSLDLETMVAGVQLRANEIELDRLEQLRIEDEERSRAAAEQRNRLIAEQRRAREAAEAAARAEADRVFAEEEARRRAEEEATLDDITGIEQVGTPPTQPLDLGLPPANPQF